MRTVLFYEPMPGKRVGCAVYPDPKGLEFAVDHLLAIIVEASVHDPLTGSWYCERSEH